MLNWKDWVMEKSEPLLRKHSTPLPLRELAWRGVKFAAKCGRSNPVSFALRPLVSHKHLKRMVGWQIAVMAIATAILGPLPTIAGSGIGGPVSLTINADENIPLKTNETVVAPMDNMEVSQKFWLLHSGIDMRTPVGTPVKSVMKGVAVKAEKSSFGYGNMVEVSHGNGFTTLYAHLSKILIKEGQEVVAGQIVGDSGSTGRSSGPHLHFELKENGRTINPASLLGL